MASLRGSSPKETSLIEEILATPAVAGRLDLAAAIWLYVDDIDRAHAACQELDTPTGALWHGIVHRREGDFNNSLYWMKRAAKHPLVLDGTLDPAALVEAVEASWTTDDAVLVERQREEWRVLFEWCCGHEA
jgi:hypothetical protein